MAKATGLSKHQAIELAGREEAKRIRARKRQEAREEAKRQKDACKRGEHTTGGRLFKNIREDGSSLFAPIKLENNENAQLVDICKHCQAEMI